MASVLSFCIAFNLSFASTPGAPERIEPPEAVRAMEAYQKRLYDKVAPTVVHISTRTGQGSGFFVSPRGLILTNAHVVGDAASINVVIYN
jgi:S1-C subfamily serine protease